MTNEDKRCGGFFHLVPFGTELHTVCIDCQRRKPQLPSATTTWHSFVVNKDNTCDHKISTSV